MSEVAIKIEKLSKVYQLNIGKKRSLASTLSSSFKSVFSKNESHSENFWALNDISFEIKKGEAIGIIGKNGAGKSTLLKILSRITEPTSGSVEIDGRISSLLEVGTGFHPELSGRENIFLNGTILGMKRIEIKKKFDEIVAFSGIEKFIDTPVKRYSSGMYVRLAFAVAAHLEPEILIIDEVLAVGDIEFQNKCLGKMNEVAGQGRTVIFVSHQMGTIAQLCNKAILLQQGGIIKSGNTQEVIDFYTRSSLEAGKSVINSHQDGELQIKSIHVLNDQGNYQGAFGVHDEVGIRVDYLVLEKVKGVMLGIAITDKYDRKVFTSNHKIDEYIIPDKQFTAIMKIPALFLTPGKYNIIIAIHIPNVRYIQHMENIAHFSVIETGSDFSMFEGTDYGCVFSNCKWTVAQL
jgi:lipopolysaccharide transport system ATP-binding protein